MGYSEIYCHLCGVSFNIARHRKPGEPDLASWDYTGRQCDEPGVDEVDDLEECAKNGCCVAVKHPKDEDDMVHDPDYFPLESDVNEPYEYDSDYESTEAMSFDGKDEEQDDGSMHDAELYHDFLSRTLVAQNRLHGEPMSNFGNLNASTNEIILPITSNGLPDGYEPEELEHIPGPTCAEANAYSGYAISLEEMRGCRTAQFLVHKSASESWQPDGLHETWETCEDWFLSGVCDGLVSRDSGFPTVWPKRGGVRCPQTDNVNFDPEWSPANNLAMPFHPWCFDIFCRQSKACFKKVNVSGLMKWRNAQFGWDDFRNFPRAGDVFEAQEQFWCHNPGKEYLAANPLYVPGLSRLLAGAQEEDDFILNSGDLRSSQPVTNIPAPSQSQIDFLTTLPLDIRLLVVGYLVPVDISSLRMTSKAWAELPNNVWYRLVREEMPWLWEAWDEPEASHVPSPWTTLTANEVKSLYKERKCYSRVLGDEYTPPNKIVDYLLPLPRAVGDQLKLSKANTDWHRVYTQIKRNYGGLKGLRNRRRIWEDVEEIIRRIREHETR